MHQHSILCDRFGETLALLHKCEVMVKDVADSKRINQSINSAENPRREKQKFPVSCMILSAQFWPSFKEERLQLPEEVLKELETYTEAFQELKGNRTLNWKHHLGQVCLCVCVCVCTCMYVCVCIYLSFCLSLFVSLSVCVWMSFFHKKSLQ